MQAKRQVFFNCDENYLTPLTVMTYSLFRNADPSKPLTLYVATSDKFLELGYDERIRQLVAPFTFGKVVFLNAEKALAKFQSVIGSELNVWSPVMWSGSLITEVLPPEATGNVVYLDVDMLVRKDLTPLFELDLESGNYLMAAVNEITRKKYAYLEKSGWPKEAGPYFNYGTMVINTDAWRRENTVQKILTWYGAHRDTMFLNQDSQNVVCGARTLRIHPKWNLFDNWLQRSVRMNPFATTWRVHKKREIIEGLLDPAVIHFVGREKPWAFCRRPTRRYYHAVMKELGLYDAKLAEGATVGQKLKLAFFDAYHAFLRGYVRLLLRISR